MRTARFERIALFSGALLLAVAAHAADDTAAAPASTAAQIDPNTRGSAPLYGAVRGAWRPPTRSTCPQ